MFSTFKVHLILIFRLNLHVLEKIVKLFVVMFTFLQK